MKISEIREMKQEDLQVRLGELRRKLYDLRCQRVTEKLEDCYALSNCRKDIARLETVLRENQLKVQ